MDVFAWIEENRPELQNRVVFITAGAYTPEVRAFLARVPNTVLHKPFDTKTLRWTVAQKLTTHSAQFAAWIATRSPFRTP